MQTDREGAKEKKQINWNEYNYPPLLKLMHFRPSELPQDRKVIILLLFSVHIMCLVTTILNIIASCVEGGLNILYSFFFFFILNTIIMFLFYRGHIGLCKNKSKLRLYTIIQPLAIIIEFIVAIIDFLCFNGFVRVAALFSKGQGFAATLSLVISLLFIVMGGISGYVYFIVCKEKNKLITTLL